MKYLIMTIFVCVFYSMNAQWKPGDPLIDKRDGQVYKTVQIGSQIWMSENLNYGKMIVSNKAGYQMKDDGIVEKYCWNNDTVNCCGSGTEMKRGAFYEWKEAMNNYNETPKLPVQGICPDGWHIPSNKEWNLLFSYLGNDNLHKQLLKGGSSGFDALLTGYRCTMTGSFRVSATAADTRTYFWTSEPMDNENSPLIELGANSITSFSFYKSLGLCVRCIKDDQASDVDEESDASNSVYPNPALDIVYLSDHSGDVLITDILGNIVWKGMSTENKITVKDFAKGVYFIKYIDTKKSLKSVKLIKQ